MEVVITMDDIRNPHATKLVLGGANGNGPVAEGTVDKWVADGVYANVGLRREGSKYSLAYPGDATLYDSSNTIIGHAAARLGEDVPQ